MHNILSKGEYKIDGGHMLNIAERREPMPRKRQARLDKQADPFPVRLPAPLGAWLREYADQHDLSINAAFVEAVELLRASKAKG